MFLKTWECIEKEKKVIRYITDDLKSSDNSNEFDEEESTIKHNDKVFSYKR